MGVVGASLLIFTAGPAAMLAVPWLQRAHLIADTPLWLLVALLAACSATNACAQSFEGRMSPTVGLQVRAATAAISTAWVIYATGWGSILVIGFGVGIADAMRAHGSRAWKPCLCWSAVAIFGGEMTIAFGLAPTICDRLSRTRSRGPLSCASRSLPARSGRPPGGRESDRADRARPVLLP